MTADREFIEREWVHWLLQKQVPFRIRNKANSWLQAQDGQEKCAGDWFALRACRCKPHPMCVRGLRVYVGGKRIGSGQYLVVISNEASKDLCEEYRLRWKIETLFQALKGHGFDLESCRLSQSERLSGWFGFLALGVCWCLKAGERLTEIHPLPLKKHGRRAVSVFQRGARLLQQLVALLAGQPSPQQFGGVLELLKPRSTA